MQKQPPIMKQSEFNKYSLLGQIGVWSILFMIYVMDEMEYSGVFKSLLYACMSIGIIMMVVYTHYYIVFPLFHRGKRWLYFISTLLLILFFDALTYCLDIYFPSDERYEIFFWDYMVYNFFLLIMFIAVSSIYYFVEAWYKNFKQKTLLRNEKLQAELNFLKSQINPHFLFNTLNNIYAYAQTGNPKTAPMLERLSSILRFMVYDCSEEKVALSKELDAVEDLLEIHKMKNSEQRNIQLKITGVKSFHLIAPLIIVNLAENACKHSDVVSNSNGFIAIHISVDKADNCLLEISNSVKQKQVIFNRKYAGVGLENIKKRLDLQYGKAYTFEERKENKTYHLKLNILLERKK